MSRNVSVRLWMIVVAGIAVVFLLQQAYFKPCQGVKGGPCNTLIYGYCCPGTNMVCGNHQCVKLLPGP